MNERRRLLKEYIRDDADEELDYLTIIPYTEVESYISRIAVSQPYSVIMTDGSEYYGNIWYSVDGGEWVLYGGGFIDVPCFSKVRFKGDWHEVMKDVEYNSYEGVASNSLPSFYSESGSDWWLLEGTPLSLIHGDNFKERKNDWNYPWDSFYNMFNGNNNVGQINNPKTFLPSTELCDGCYQNMFSHSSICNAPELPAETLKKGCYIMMFDGCVNLEEAPALNAKTLVQYCYQRMFYNCVNLRYVKMTAIDGFDAGDPVYEMFQENAGYGLAMLSQELIDGRFHDAYFQNWAVISEDYPTNEQGYPETKGSIDGYDVLCFNEEFVERRVYDSVYYNLFLSEANESGKQLFDGIASSAIDKNVFYPITNMFINRRPAIRFVWSESEIDGEVISGLIYFFDTSYSTGQSTLYSDGHIESFKPERLIYDYIKK